MRKKDQWIIHNISTGESKSFDIKTPKRSPRFYMAHIKRSYRRPIYFTLFRALKRFKKLFAFRKNTYKKNQLFYRPQTRRTHVEIPQLRWLFSNTIKGGLTVLISVLVIYGVVHAGTIIPPSGTPSAQFYTLSEIYNFITSNTTSTEGGHSFTFSDSLAGTGRTLSEIYNALASLISADKVKLGTTYLGMAGTYNADNLSTATVKKGTAFGVSETGAYSGYPGSGVNRAGLTQAACASATDWYWFEDANGDGDSANPDDPEDGICVLAKAQTTVGSWNGYDSATNPDNTYIADYTCDGVSFPNGSVATYSGIDSAGNPDTTWNQGDCALCQADCYDGVKDLPGNGGYKSAPGDGTATGDYNGPLTPKVLAEWKGTRLPTSADFFGFCGRKDGVPSPYNSPYDYENTTSADSASTTYGNYGGQVGRTDEFLDLANTNYEWLSGQHGYSGARIAGIYACSLFWYNYVDYGYRFRAVFRP